MQSFRPRAFLAALLLPAALLAASDVSTEGTITIGGGGALLSGDRPAFQKTTQHKKDGFGGIEEFRLSRESKDWLFNFDARIMPGDDDYRLAARWEKPEKFYLDAGFEQFRVFSDGTAGFFRPTNTSFRLYNEDLSLTRSKAWLELGAYTANQTLLRFRYEYNARNGTKGSTHWGDTNLVGIAGTRNIVPSFYDLDETTHLFSVDVGNDSREDVKWNVGARYSETELNNNRNMRRRPSETADRIVTQKDATKTDLFAAHGFYERKVNEQLTVSAGALITDLDSAIGGSRIYGQAYDPVFDPAYLRRQQRDEGYFDLTGHAEMKQTILNLNAVYFPRKNWSVRPSIRFENLHQETVSEFMETNIGAGPAFAAIVEEVEGEQKKKWNEFAESLELRYTGKPNWTFSTEGEWVQGSGNVDEERILHTGVLTIDRDNDNTRMSQKYSAKANWYAKPGLTFAAQYYYKSAVNDYDAVRDNTPAGTADRYPAYITDQDFETNDFNFRVSWRPASLLSFVTRYDFQRSRIKSQEKGLAPVESSEMTSHILSESITWSPTARLYLSGSVNVTWDQLATPAYRFVLNSDNNYVNGSLGGGYALAKKDDVYLDYSFFRASNFADNSTLSLPYGASQKQQATYLTWVRRQSDTLIYTVKYGYLTNRDGTWAGRADFDAHMIYAKVQYHF
ncbi:MAG TPA: hypothetical protein VHO24_18900 [Opitutaceae bacterium]|nr:hypothetical protein [Opitutaceae bacterium]